MALVDPRSDTVVIRVVYDGAPLAGKTTSIRALSKGLGSQVVSPAEIGGRTLYFDWFDYTGGLFEGRRIRCQIISVPGQATLAPRRRRLLESADAVVFVGDSSPGGFEQDRGYLLGLCNVLNRLSGPPVGIVLQANKRDHPQAVAIHTVRLMLDELSMRIGVVESIATEGTGIRECFVFAVRLALDRVRELMRLGQLHTQIPPIDSAPDLLGDLQRSEADMLNLAAESSLQHIRLREIQPPSLAAQALSEAIQDMTLSENSHVEIPGSRERDDAYVPAAPDERVASGLIWPPVEGRTILHELATAHFTLNRSSRGDWSAIVNERWRVRSPVEAVYEELEEGRSVLVETARMHAAHAQGTPVDRCVVLAADGCGNFRLWQIVKLAQNAISAQVQPPSTT